jgi:hypothetical protein
VAPGRTPFLKSAFVSEPFLMSTPFSELFFTCFEVIVVAA